MPITTRQRKPNGYVILVSNTAGDGVTLNGTTNGANATADEVVQEMRIAEVMWSIDGGSWDIRRGSNTILQLSGSGHHDYQAHGIRIEEDEAQLTSNVNVNTAGVGSIILKLHKVSGE